MQRLLARLPSGTPSLKESDSESCAGTVIVVDSSDDEAMDQVAFALQELHIMDRPLLW